MNQSTTWRHQFAVEVNGKTYGCERVVTGKRKRRQEIHVIGVGRKGDHADYGKDAHPVGTMEGIARLIAVEIINQHDPKQTHGLDAQQLSQQRERVCELVKSLNPLLEKCQRKLQGRKVRTEICAANDYALFKMFYANGDYRGVELRKEGVGYELFCVFREDGCNHEATGSGDLTQAGFEKLLQREIEDFFLRANRHGGYGPLR